MKHKIIIYTIISGVTLGITGCKTPKINQEIENHQSLKLPSNYSNVVSNELTSSTGLTPWRQFFTDKDLVELIDIALNNNQELMITLQEIEIAKNEIAYRKGKLVPTVNAKIGIGIDKPGRYTSEGAGDATTEIKPGKEMPDPLTEFIGGIDTSWEIDIWHKLRTEKQAAIQHYLATVEGKNFILTNLISEVASSYYELLALDNQLTIIQQNIQLQKDALNVVKIQKSAAKVSELAVKKFEAELLKSEGFAFQINQEIVERENRINALLGRYPQPIKRTKDNFMNLIPETIHTGIPSELLSNRPDIKQAELELKVSELDVKVARTAFYPSLDISATLGLQAFNPSYLLRMPESIIYSAVADFAGPLINKSAIKVAFNNANARQIQALYEYDKTILNAYVDVANQVTKINNIENSLDRKQHEVDTLNESINLAQLLFKNARADYLEVLMTQRDALDAKLELIEKKEQQLNNVVKLYKSLGGGWK